MICKKCDCDTQKNNFCPKCRAQTAMILGLCCVVFSLLIAILLPKGAGLTDIWWISPLAIGAAIILGVCSLTLLVTCSENVTEFWPEIQPEIEGKKIDKGGAVALLLAVPISGLMFIIVVGFCTLFSLDYPKSALMIIWIAILFSMLAAKIILIDKNKVPILIFSLSCFNTILAVILSLNSNIFSWDVIMIHFFLIIMALSIITAIIVITIYFVNMKIHGKSALALIGFILSVVPILIYIRWVVTLA